MRWTRGDIYIYVYMSGYINPYYSHANWLILNFFLQKNSTTITAALDNELMMTSSQSKKEKWLIHEREKSFILIKFYFWVPWSHFSLFIARTRLVI